MSLMVS